jgi:hypothetical protein
MYVIAIGWLYVTVLMAATEPNLTAGVLTFTFYGLAPLALFLWLFGTPQRRRNRAAAGAQRERRKQTGPAPRNACRIARQRYSSQIRLAMRPVTPSRR